jgi:ectoine hydrolase
MSPAFDEIHRQSSGIIVTIKIVGLKMALPKAEAVFPPYEYPSRLAAVKQRMAERGIDALLLSDFPGIVYLTGYTGDSAYVPQILLVDQNDDAPIFLCRRMDAPGAYHQSWMPDGHVIGYPESYVGAPDRNGFDFAAAHLRPKLSNRRVGAELGTLSRANEERLKNGLGHSNILDATGLVGSVRIVKSDAEIIVMRQAAAITDAAFERARVLVRSGTRENDLAAEIMAALARGAGGYGGTYIQPPLICSGPRIGTPHITWTEDIYRPGMQVNIELGAARHRYVSALMRTFHVGPPPARLVEMHNIHREGLEAALAAMRPGAECADVARAFNTTIAKHGITKESRCGYSIGIGWMEGSASLMEADHTILQPNMTFHLMLGNWIDDDFGYVISETLRVTETGHEAFSKIPRELFVAD